MGDKFPKRKHIRLSNFDYSQKGYYFITICTYNRQFLFGNINQGSIKLNKIGEIIDYTWNDLINHNKIKLHNYVIMPDHIHGIIEIPKNDNCRERSTTVPNTKTYRFGIPEIIRQFKSFSSKRINMFLTQNGYKPFLAGKLWQKSYYEHIIRNEEDFREISEYIINNPRKWECKKKGLI